ncbi:MAG: hypothetical protein ACRDYZ_12810 [Acidimicrobiales bacterium]
MVGRQRTAAAAGDLPAPTRCLEPCKQCTVLAQAWLDLPTRERTGI